MRETTNITVFIVFSVLACVSVASAQLPDPGMKCDPANTALVITDPQNDFLSPEGVTWGVVGKSVKENHTVANIEALLKAAKKNGLLVFISPHYYFPTDKGWKFEGALEVFMHKVGMFDRSGALSLEGFEDSGADWTMAFLMSTNLFLVISTFSVSGTVSVCVIIECFQVS